MLIYKARAHIALDDPQSALSIIPESENVALRDGDSTHLVLKRSARDTGQTYAHTARTRRAAGR